jgi:hypothetical protein
MLGNQAQEPNNQINQYPKKSLVCRLDTNKRQRKNESY